MARLVQPPPLSKADRRRKTMTRLRTGLLGVVMLAAGCAYNPPVVPLEARPAEIEKLAGSWNGAYDGDTSGRSGSIEFSLVAGEDHAHGDVLMIPSHSQRPYRSWRDGEPFREAEMSEVLTIRFVTVENGEITGELDPYRDPECDCRALTRFQGRLRGNVIEGTFTTSTTRAGGLAHGTWKVRRQRH
jgi:hypothetical protein